MTKIIISILSICLACPMLRSQTVYKLSVGELLEKGIENSLAIQSATIKTSIADDKKVLARNKQLPDISVGGLFGYVGNSTILDTDLSFLKHSNPPDWKQNYHVDINQPLYQGGKIKNNIKKSELEEELAQLSLENDKTNLKLALIQKYLNLFTLYKQRDILSKNIEEAKVRLHDIENMKREGMITNNDVLRSKLTLTNYEISYDSNQNDIILLSQQLAIAMGMDEELVYEPDDTVLALNPDLRSQDDYLSLAYSRYPELKMANTNIELAKNNLKIAKGDILPTLSLQATNTFARPIPYSSPVQDLYVNSWGVSLNLSYRISSLFDRKHNVGAAKRQILLQNLAQEQEKQTIRTNVKSAYVKHFEALERINAIEESLIQANENYRIVKNKYFTQLAILTDLLDADNVQMNAEYQLVAAKVNAIYTYYQLEKVSGNL